MWNAERAVDELRRRGELWSPAPGLIGLRGDALRLRRELDRELQSLCVAAADEEWQLPPALPLQTLARADYFASFPQWLTTAAHLTDDVDRLLALSTAAAADVGTAVAAAAALPAAALQPALCYHIYAAYADTTLSTDVCIACDGTCWRHERQRHAPLERGWAFTMREVVTLGEAHAVATRLAAQRAAAVAFARRLGMRADIDVAEDPFFAPSARGRALIQRLRTLKHELLLPLGDGRTVAAASFNHHEQFFGDAFGIRSAAGSAAISGCTAFGVERWLLAVLVEHGARPEHWPVLGRDVPAAASRTDRVATRATATLEAS